MEVRQVIGVELLIYHFRVDGLRLAEVEPSLDSRVEQDAII